MVPDRNEHQLDWRLRRWLPLLTAVVAAALAGGCAGEQDAGASGDGNWEPGPGSDTGNGAPSQDAGADSSQPPPPEEEVALALGVPTATQGAVWIPNATSGGVARIDAATLSVTVVPTGPDPLSVAPVPGAEAVVVLDGVEHHVTRVDGVTGATVQVSVLPGANRFRVSPDGQWVAAWYDAAAWRAGRPLGSLQEVSWVDFRSGRHVVTSVGWRVQDVVFATGEAAAVVVTRDQVHRTLLASLTADRVLDGLALQAPDALDGAGGEFLATADARFVAVRAAGRSDVRVVDFETSQVQTIELSGEPTDIDVSADGTFVLAAVRDAGEVVRIDLPLAGEGVTATFAVTEVVPGVVDLIGDQQFALVYSTVTGAPAMVRLDVTDESAAQVLVPLRRTPATVTATPDGTRVIVVHRPPVANASAWLDRQEAVSLVDLERVYVKLELLPSAVDQVAFVESAGAFFLMLADEGQRTTTLLHLDLETFRRNETVFRYFGEHLAALPAGDRVFVSFRDDAGRMVFVDGDGADIRQVAGYRLNGLVE